MFLSVGVTNTLFMRSSKHWANVKQTSSN